MIKYLQNRTQKEDGGGEVISALFVIPMIMLLLFFIVDMGGFYFTMGQVSDVTKEATRQVAIYGGNNSTLAKNKLGTSVSSALSSKLKELGVSVSGVSCSGGGLPGDVVSCSVTFKYDSVLASAGIGGLAEPQTITQYSVAETWSN